MQETRRMIVIALLNEKDLKEDDIEILKRAYERLTDNQTHSFQREMCTLTTKLSVNIRDETKGLEVCLFFFFFYYLYNCSKLFDCRIIIADLFHFRYSYFYLKYFVGFIISLRKTILSSLKKYEGKHFSFQNAKSFYFANT